MFVMDIDSLTVDEWLLLLQQLSKVQENFAASTPALQAQVTAEWFMSQFKGAYGLAKLKKHEELL